MSGEQGWLPSWPEYLPDRYDRLAGGINEIATTPEFFHPEFVTPDVLRDLGAKIAADRMLDRLTDRDADVVVAITALTFPGGIPKMVRAIGDQMRGIGGCLPSDDNKAVVSVLAGVLAAAYEMVKDAL